jgi:hypothetical protein
LTPLLISSKEGNLDVIKSLMSRQARLDAFDQVRQVIWYKTDRINNGCTAEQGVDDTLAASD